MYEDYEIPIKKNPAVWLATFRVNDERMADTIDMKIIRNSITNTFHKTGRAIFTTKQSKTDKQITIIKRIK